MWLIPTARASRGPFSCAGAAGAVRSGERVHEREELLITPSPTHIETPDPRGRALARVFACVVVVLGHALMAYTPNAPAGILWPVREPCGIGAMDHVIAYGRFAIVGIFFFLSGEAARFAVMLLGSRELWRASVRVLLPGLAVGCFIVMPCVYVAWAADAVDRGYIKWEQFWAFRLSIEDKALLIGPGNFWFVEHLLLITLGAFVCVRYAPAVRPGTRRLMLPLCFAGVGIAAWMDPVVLGTFRNDFIPHASYLAINACVFAAGWFADGRVRMWPLWLLLSLPLAVVGPGSSGGDALDSVLGATASLAGVLGWVGACEFLSSRLPDMSRLSRLTPGVYFVHLPIVCFGQYVLRPVEASPMVKAIQVTIAALVVATGVAALMRSSWKRGRRKRVRASAGTTPARGEGGGGEGQE